MRFHGCSNLSHSPLHVDCCQWKLKHMDLSLDRVTCPAMLTILHQNIYSAALREGDIRLVGQGPQNEGILEFYSWEHGWATLCTSDWDDSDAQVACTQLGYEGGKSNTSRFA